MKTTLWNKINNQKMYDFNHTINNNENIVINGAKPCA
jgi:hypothetical protein